MSTNSGDDDEIKISWQSINDGIKENIGIIYTVLYIILWVALAEAGYAFEMFIVTIIITAVALYFQWDLIKAAFSYGRNKGQELRKTKAERQQEALEDIKEALK